MTFILVMQLMRRPGQSEIVGPHHYTPPSDREYTILYSTRTLSERRRRIRNLINNASLITVHVRRTRGVYTARLRNITALPSYTRQ